MPKAKIFNESNRFKFYSFKFSSFAIILILIGVYILLKDMGIIPNISIWSILFITIGIFLLLRK
ncbi:MAG: hypothetical protein ISS82_04155 [Nanoarchaeota archaeon]|nr:hypothetical protein [Nanoarchaeota archaeon]